MINNSSNKFYFKNKRIVILESFEEIGLSKVCYVENSEIAFVKSSEIKNKLEEKENEIYLKEKIEMIEEEIKSLNKVIYLLKDMIKIIEDIKKKRE